MKFVEIGAREILGEMSNKEYLACRAIVGIMPHLNRVFEELGIHHEEHEVPMKVRKSLEGKAKKVAAKNTTAMAEVKKRKGASGSKIVSKKQKTMTTSAATSTGIDEEVAQNIGGGSASVAASMEGEHSTTTADLGGDDFVQTALQGMGGGSTAEASTVAPMLAILSDESSSSKGEDNGCGDASPSKDAEVGSADCHPMRAPLIEESEDESEHEPPLVWSLIPIPSIGSHQGEDIEMDPAKRYFVSE